MKLPKSGSHCTHLLESAGVGAKQVSFEAYLRVADTKGA